MGLLTIGFSFKVIEFKFHFRRSGPTCDNFDQQCTGEDLLHLLVSNNDITIFDITNGNYFLKTD